LYFSLLWSSKQTLNIVSNLGQQLVGLQLVAEMKLYGICVFLNDLKDLYGDVRGY
jgi:hypothetical protein